MGYSARYHAFSIIAVFAALAVGVVVGAGLGSDFVSGTTESLEESLKGDVRDARAEVDAVSADLGTERTFGTQVYPGIVGGRLDHERVGLISLGPLPDELAADVQAALTPTGAEVARVAVVRVPPDAEELSRAHQGSPIGRLAGAPGRLRELGRRVGLQMADGGRLFGRGRAALLERFSGSAGRVDRLVVMRSATSDLGEEELRAVDEYEAGMIAGIRESGVPVVGVERTTTDPSSISFFATEGIATVDDVDLTAGKVSMVLVLLGAEGSYGVKNTADSLLPELLRGSGAGRGPAGSGEPQAAAP